MIAYGVAELAEAIGVRRNTLAVWLCGNLGEIPEPDVRLACGPVWLDSPELREWIRETRRHVRARDRKRRMRELRAKQDKRRQANETSTG